MKVGGGPLCLLLTVAAVALALAATWPAATALGTHVHGFVVDADTQNGLWWPSACAEALAELRNPFFARDLNWPEGQDLTGLVWNIGAEIVLAPIHLLAGPVLGMNLAALAMMVLDGLACAWAAWRLVGSRSAALAALVVGATASYTWTEAGSGRQEQALWAPLAVYLGAYLQLARTPGARGPLLLAAASLAASGVIYWYNAYFLLIITGLDTAIRVGRPGLSRRALLDRALMLLLALAFMSPFLVPVVRTLLADDATLRAVAASRSTPVQTQIQGSLHLGRFMGVVGEVNPRQAAPAPLLLLPLCGWLALRGPSPARAAGAWGLTAGVLAAGPLLLGIDQHPIQVLGGVLYLPGALLDRLPGMARFWWPYRWLQVALPCLAIAAGAFVHARAHPWRHLLWLVPFCLAETAWELRVPYPPGQAPMSRFDVPASVLALRDAPRPAPVLHVPVGGTASELAWPAFHGQPVDLGLAWHIPGVRTAGWEERMARNRLVQAIEGRSRAPARWTLQDTGGFRYVLLEARFDPEGALARRLQDLLGPPLSLDARVGVWRIDIAQDGAAHLP